VIAVEFRRDFWRQKARVPGLSCGFDCVILGLAIDVSSQVTRPYGCLKVFDISKVYNITF